MRVLVVEDDSALLETISDVLQEEAFQVDRAMTGDEGLHLAEQGIYDLLVLDIMLPGMCGLTLVRRLRDRSNDVPVLLLTAKDRVEDRVHGLDAGADDYMIKPFAVPELLARVRALLRRNGGVNSKGVITCGPLSIKPKLQEAYMNGQPLKLTPKEYELMEYFIINKNQIITKEQIYDRVWGFETDAGYGVVDLYIHYLRKKMAAYGCGQWIHTVRGVGYRFKEQSINDV